MNEFGTIPPQETKKDELFFDIENTLDFKMKLVLECYEDDEEYSIVRSTN